MNHKETGNSMFNEITTTRMNPYHVKERDKKKIARNWYRCAYNKYKCRYA